MSPRKNHKALFFLEEARKLTINGKNIQCEIQKIAEAAPQITMGPRGREVVVNKSLSIPTFK